MKIVYIIHGLYNSGGMEKILTEKANSLAEDYGYEVTVITSEQKGRKPFFALSGKVRTLDLGVNYHLPLFRRRLRKALMELRPDVTVSFCGGEMHRLAQIKDGSKKVAELHFSHGRYYFRPGKGPLHDLIARRKTKALEKAAVTMDAFVVLTRKDLETWKDMVPQACQIYNFADFPDMEPAALESRRCISVGRLIPSKNYPEMLQAWKMVTQRHPDWVLDIYGRGGEKGRLLKLIGSMGLEGKVEIHAPVKNITEKLAGSSCFIFTSLNEGMGLALVEAAGAGLPAVSYDISCGPSEIIEDGVSGYLVAPHDVQAMARSICRIIEDDGLRHSMGQAARVCAGRFRKENVMAQWKEFFESF